MQQILIFFFLFTMLGNATSQPDREDKAKRQEARSDLKEELREWATGTIFPKLSEWKGELEGAMTAEDLGILNRLRSQAKELRGKIREHRHGLRQAWKDEDRKAMKEHRAALTETRKAWLDIVEALEPIAFRYRKTLKEIGVKARPTVKEWREEGKKIILRWMARYDGITQSDMHRLLKYGDLPRRWFNGTDLKRKGVARFMLWDGDTTVGQENISGTGIPDIQ